MRSTALLLAILGGSAAFAFACGGSGDANPTGASSSGSSGDNNNPTPFNPADQTDGGESGGQPENIESMRIDPENATLDVTSGVVATKAFKVLAKIKEKPGQEIDITARSRFYVPTGYLIGTFPADGGPLFSTRLPTAANPEPARGGLVTVQAQAANSDKTITTVTTTLTVRLSATGSFAAGSPEATPAIPANPTSFFTGAPDAAHAPVIHYPNDGVIVPPNLKRLEIHFKKGNAADTLFEVTFSSALGSVVLYTRCTDTPTDFAANALEAGACALRLDEAMYGALAETNRGLGPVDLKVRGTNEAGVFGESAIQKIEFAENRVDGGVYYWTASNPPRIMRFDFGSGTGVPEPYLVPGQGGLGNECVGCHSLSRDGTKLFAGVGNSSKGNLVFIQDVKAKTLVVNGADAAPANTNRVLLGSFDPTASLFVAAAPVNDAAAETKLMFHDATTGLRSFNLDAGFVASHPDWSPDGKSIAVTRIGGSNQTSIEFHGGGIDVLKNDGATWTSATTLTDVQVVPPVANKNRYNPTFMPNSSILLYTEASCDTGAPCNGYSDPSAKTWAVTPTAAATQVLLANAAKPGKNDGVATNLMDTFARATPFETVHRGGKLLWFTVSSQRRAGLRKFFPNPSVVGDPATQQTLWMFAVDPAKVLAGQDGSATGFFLPFQDMTTSNHMAQWTQKIVSDNPPPPPPPAPPPPPPPPPPPTTK